MNIRYISHLIEYHNSTQGTCSKRGDACPQAGLVYTADGQARTHDDPDRQWTVEEIDAGEPWKVSVDPINRGGAR